MTEQVTPVEEVKDQTSEVEPGKEPVSQEPSDNVSDNGEKEPEEVKGKTYTSEQFDEAVSAKAEPLAQSMKDKELKEVYATITKHEQTIAELETKKDDEDVAVLYGEEKEELGEDGARKNREARTRQNANFKTYRAQAREVATQYKEVQEVKELAKKLGVSSMIGLADTLGAERRDSNATKDMFRIVLPEGKEIISEVNAGRKRLNEAETEKEYGHILKAIEAEYKSSGKTQRSFKPDPSTAGIGGGLDLSKLTGRQLLELAEKQEKKKK